MPLVCKYEEKKSKRKYKMFKYTLLHLKRNLTWGSSEVMWSIFRSYMKDIKLILKPSMKVHCDKPKPPNEYIERSLLSWFAVMKIHFKWITDPKWIRIWGHNIKISAIWKTSFPTYLNIDLDQSNLTLSTISEWKNNFNHWHPKINESTQKIDN